MNVKRILSLLLTMALLISMIACAKEELVTTAPATATQEWTETEELTAEEPSVTTTKAPTTTTVPPVTLRPSVDYGKWEHYTPVLKNNLTVEQVNALPIANYTMSAEKLRDICWDFMAFQMNVAWKVDYSYASNEGGKWLTYKTDTVYGGMPYSSSTFNNIYQFLYYYDSETSTLDVTALRKNSVASALKDKGQTDLVAVQVGNQCSASSLWAWARVSNAISWGGTSNIMPRNGAIILGDTLAAYHKQNYSNVKDYHSAGMATKDILAGVGESAVYEGYKLLQKADGLAYYNKGGHVMMVHHVDVEKQLVYVQDQTVRRSDKGGAFVAAYRSFDFSYLYKNGYLPFTIPEFVGLDPVETGMAEFGYEGSEITVKDLLAHGISANYMISDVTVKVLNGEETVKEYFYTTTVNGALFGAQTENKETVCLRSGNASRNLGATETQYSALAGQGYTVRMDVRISTGEVFTVYTGSLV